LVEEAAGVVVGLSVEKKKEAADGRDSREADDDGLWWAIVALVRKGDRFPGPVPIQRIESWS
jgi:hypothetical protein